MSVYVGCIGGWEAGRKARPVRSCSNSRRGLRRNEGDDGDEAVKRRGSREPAFELRHPSSWSEKGKEREQTITQPSGEGFVTFVPARFARYNIFTPLPYPATIQPGPARSRNPSRPPSRLGTHSPNVSSHPSPASPSRSFPQYQNPLSVTSSPYARRLHPTLLHPACRPRDLSALFSRHNTPSRSLARTTAFTRITARAVSARAVLYPN